MDVLTGPLVKPNCNRSRQRFVLIVPNFKKPSCHLKCHFSFIFNEFIDKRIIIVTMYKCIYVFFKSVYLFRIYIPESHEFIYL